MRPNAFRVDEDSPPAQLNLRPMFEHFAAESSDMLLQQLKAELLQQQRKQGQF